MANGATVSVETNGDGCGGLTVSEREDHASSEGEALLGFGSASEFLECLTFFIAKGKCLGLGTGHENLL